MEKFLSRLSIYCLVHLIMNYGSLRSHKIREECPDLIPRDDFYRLDLDKTFLKGENSILKLDPNQDPRCFLLLDTDVKYLELYWSNFEESRALYNNGSIRIRLFSIIPTLLTTQKSYEICENNLYDQSSFCSWLYNWKTPNGEFVSDVSIPIENDEVTKDYLNISNLLFQESSSGKIFCIIKFTEDLSQNYVSTFHNVKKVEISLTFPDIPTNLQSPKPNLFFPNNPSCHLFESSKVLKETIHEQIQMKIHKLRFQTQYELFTNAIKYNYTPDESTSQMLTLEKDYATLIHIEYDPTLRAEINSGQNLDFENNIDKLHVHPSQFFIDKAKWFLNLPGRHSYTFNKEKAGSKMKAKAYLLLENIESSEMDAVVSKIRDPFGKYSFYKYQSPDTSIAEKLEVDHQTSIIELGELEKNYFSSMKPSIKHQHPDELKHVWVMVFPTISKVISMKVKVIFENSDKESKPNITFASIIVLSIAWMSIFTISVMLLFVVFFYIKEKFNIDFKGSRQETLIDKQADFRYYILSDNHKISKNDISKELSGFTPREIEMRSNFFHNNQDDDEKLDPKPSASCIEKEENFMKSQICENCSEN